MRIQSRTNQDISLPKRQEERYEQVMGSDSKQRHLVVAGGSMSCVVECLLSVGQSFIHDESVRFGQSASNKSGALCGSSNNLCGCHKIKAADV